ncbi:ferritin-like domain-containing protein [Negadavirga shengliensis]|uniref:Ferritin-like protein n=1 Tax=Negadavirga shengliensis TaxID=1389218 RepID=A0ABV9T0W7_9BACT
MLKLHPQYIASLQTAERLPELFPLVQNAIELEHSTIPPYLTAMFSIKPNTEGSIWNILHSIVIEEMLHMTIASNILNALGGQPKIDLPNFVPEYPSPLPMGIGDGLRVNLEKLTKDVVKNTFMVIEEPEDPLEFPIKKMDLFAAGVPVEYSTIGEFYEALKQKIDEIAPDELPGDPEKQVTSGFFDKSVLFPILTKQDAINAIDIIVEQGEGTSTSPIDFEGEIAHYYRFEEIYVGRALVKDDSVETGYSFSGEEITFDPANIQPLFPNTKASMLAPGSEERRRIDEFNAAYASLLKGLHDTFNGHPEKLNNTIGIMFDIKLLGEKLCATVFPGKPGYTIGPSFDYQK